MILWSSIALDKVVAPCSCWPIHPCDLLWYVNAFQRRWQVLLWGKVSHWHPEVAIQEWQKQVKEWTQSILKWPSPLFLHLWNSSLLQLLFLIDIRMSCCRSRWPMTTHLTLMSPNRKLGEDFLRAVQFWSPPQGNYLNHPACLWTDRSQSGIHGWWVAAVRMIIRKLSGLSWRKALPR